MIEINKKYGCLTVLDNGEEYEKTELYSERLEKSKELREVLKPWFETLKEAKEKYPEALNKDKQNNLTDSERDILFKLHHLSWEYSTQLEEYKQLNRKLEKHYKCSCKCGNINYYNKKTLETKPRFCIYPVPISTKFTYSISAQNATYRKEQKYENRRTVNNVYH